MTDETKKALLGVLDAMEAAIRQLKVSIEHEPINLFSLPVPCEYVDPTIISEPGVPT